MQIVSIDISQLTRAQEFLQLAPERLIAASRRAVNLATTTGRKIVSVDVRAVYNVRAGDVRARIETTRARRVSDKVFESRITLGNRRFPLKAFRANQTAAGVTASIRKSSGRTLYRGAWDPARRGQRLSANHVYGRIGSASFRAPRLPINPLAGPSLVVMYEDNSVENTVDQRLSEELSKKLEQELNFEIIRSGI